MQDMTELVRIDLFIPCILLATNELGFLFRWRRGLYNHRLEEFHKKGKQEPL